MFVAMITPPLRHTLFPYTTLFRSRGICAYAMVYQVREREGEAVKKNTNLRIELINEKWFVTYGPLTTPLRTFGNQNGRSEEHTSELQSHSDLVCRLLLEKKNKKHN